MTEKTIILNQPHKNQQLILNESARFNVLCCGRRFGKSALAVNLICETALEGQPAGYFTPTYKLLEPIFKEAVEVLSPVIKRKHDNQFIELITGGLIDFWSMENNYAGRGRKYKRAVADEAAFTKNLFELWTQAIRPTLTDLKGDAWFLSTPKGKNDFFKLWSRGRATDKENSKDWKSWQMTTYDNPYIDPYEIDSAKEDLPELAFSQEYMAEFNDNIANPFGTSYIQQCIFPISMEPAVCFGIDLAKSHDWTVITGLDKNCSVCHFDRFQSDWRTTTRKILDLPAAPLIIDSTGVGDPIGEDIGRHRQVELFKYTSTSKQQLMEGLAVAIQQRKITFPKGLIVDELENFEFVYSIAGVKYSAPAGMHDDCVNSLGLALKGWRPAQHYGKYSFI